MDTEYGKTLSDLALGSGWIDLQLRRVEESELIARINEAQFVVVPYADLYNSGVVLMALSVGRPVILRENAASKQLKAEFGATWIRTYKGDLTSASLRDVLTAPLPPTGSAPNFDQRRWKDIGESHFRVYHAAL
ncbi:hypothetical protein AHIS1636_27370 [Arthrobacter mangrovi]|uniref:Uncharacterized protein n=2 Tax=Arthrobacter mangrovi TaxID=2966350 RepID=A0ABQ5MWI8_9MICC|nr:hypothetical protein AHIS1636_27370 [Arthrobacter mangrovi]